MAFSSGLSPMEDCCPVCGQKKRNGRTVLNPAYGDQMQICSQCYDRCYHNKNDKLRNIESMDHPSNLLQKLRPAECLEYETLFQKKEPACGYEFPLSHILTEQIIRNVISWWLFSFALRGALLLSSTMEDPSQCLSWKAVELVIKGGSALWAISFAWHLLKGIFYGIGHTRRLTLLGAVLLMGLLVKLLY